MVDAMVLYLDDSGTRNPDRNANDALPAHGHDWFGLGGVLIREADEPAVRTRHAQLYARWGIKFPLHSAEIRRRSQNFRWLEALDAAERSEFYDSLEALVTSEKITAIACVVDRPGYNHRYLGPYGRKRWSLCKTAFRVVVERAAKYARRHGCVLRVYVERSDRKTDARMLEYYDAMRSEGSPFDPTNSAKYAPLDSNALRETLYEFKTKDKTSPLMQIADLCLWPMCIGGYDPANAPYSVLRDAGTLIDCKLDHDDLPSEGIKYSCWDLNPAR